MATTRVVAKSIIYAILNAAAVFFSGQHQTVILLYHSVGSDGLYLTVSPQDFARQMQFLKENGYQVIGLQRLLKLLQQQEPVPPKTVVLTFDDGYKTHLENVLPVLQQHNFPATFFIPTGYLGRTLNNSEHMPLPVMSQGELTALHNSGLADLEPHGVSHRELTALSVSEASQEVQNSKKQLEQILQKQCWAFAYPRGKVNAAVMQAMKDSGFALALTVEEGSVGSTNNVYLLPRYTINSATTLWEFRYKLKGL